MEFTIAVTELAAVWNKSTEEVAIQWYLSLSLQSVERGDIEIHIRYNHVVTTFILLFWS